MQCILLQDWVTVRGAISQLSIEQGEDGWLDLSPYQDLYIWTLVNEVTGPTGTTTGLYIDFQTAPEREEGAFVSMVGAPGVQLVAGSPIVTELIKDEASVPVSQWVRWVINTNNVTPTAIWDATVRVYVAANFRNGRRTLTSSGGAAAAIARAQGLRPRAGG